MEEDGKCCRCQLPIVPKQHAIFWSGMYGASFGVYCPLCWEISMSAWVLTVEPASRPECLQIVDLVIAEARKELGYVLP